MDPAARLAVVARGAFGLGRLVTGKETDSESQSETRRNPWYFS
jgi:hypothetical protein